MPLPPAGGTVFCRASIRGEEVHTEAYLAVRSSSSYRVAILYQEGLGTKTYYGEVNAFFRVCVGRQIHKLALVTTYPFAASYRGMPRIDLKHPHKTWRVISISSIQGKVIFTNDQPSFVLMTPKLTFQ